MEADLQRHYGVDLGDFWRGELSIRRLWVLLKYLPPGESAMHRALFGVRDAPWTTEAHLLARISDILAGANWQRSGKKQGKPKPLPRPKPERKAKAASIVGRMRRLGLLKDAEEE